MKHTKIHQLTLAFILLICFSANAQKAATQDLKLSYGFATSPFVASSFWHLLFNGDGSLRAFGPVGLEYTYHLGEKTAVSISGSFAQLTFKENSGATGASSIKRQSKYYTLLPQFQVYLGKTDKLETYSALALGVSYERFSSDDEYWESGKDWITAYQVTAIGVRTKAKTGLSAELGYGYKGILNVGISRRIN